MGEGGEGAGPSTLKRSTTRPLPGTSSRTVGQLTSGLSSSTSLRTFPSKRPLPSSASLPIPEDALESPQTPRTRARTRSIAAQALTHSLSRSTSGRGLAQKTEDGESPATVRPARRVLVSKPAAGTEKQQSSGKDEPTSRKKPALAGLGRPGREGKEHSLSPTTSRKPSATPRSASAMSSGAQKTPLRTSTRRPSTSSTPASTAVRRESQGERRPPPLPPPSTTAGARTLHRRTVAAGASASAIPVPASAAPSGGRLSRKPSAHSIASAASSAASSQHSAIGGVAALRRSRTEGRLGGPSAPPAVFVAGRRSSTTGPSPAKVKPAVQASRIPPRPRASQARGPGGRIPLPSSGVEQEQQHGDTPGVGDTSRRDSWVTDPDSASQPGSARPSVSGAFEPLPSFSLSTSGGEADQSWETVGSRRASAATGVPFPSSSAPLAIQGDESFATPRKAFSSSSTTATASAIGLPPSRSAISYISPDSSSTRISHSVFLSPVDSPPISALLSVSQTSASLSTSLSPGGTSPVTPRPRQVSLLRQGGRRNKPRDSASLDEILRAGLLAGDKGAQELELLLDEGSSALMREDLEAEGLGGEATPWRGRVLSLSVTSPSSAKRRSVLVPPAEDAQGEEQGTEEGGSEEEEDQEETQVLVLPLRPSTSEAVELRRQLDELRAELELARAAVAASSPSTAGADVARLATELDAARRETAKMQREHEEERTAMEADLAELAAAASQSPPSSTVRPSPSAARLSSLELDLAALHSSCASSRVATAYAGIERCASAERETARGELEAVRALMGGLRAWGGALVYA
ncbi:hypothetical protein JCM10213v2_005714 [Rhodosporidiobolus nylandii]